MKITAMANFAVIIDSTVMVEFLLGVKYETPKPLQIVRNCCMQPKEFPAIIVASKSMSTNTVEFYFIS